MCFLSTTFPNAKKAVTEITALALLKHTHYGNICC